VAALPEATSHPWPVWVSFGTPCSGVFLPVYVAGVIPPALARGTDADTVDSAWWTFSHLDEAASRDSARHTEVLRRAWAPFEAWLERERADAEATAAAEVDAGRPQRAAELLTDFMDRSVDDALERARELTREVRHAA
jgi:dipeptidase